MAFPGQQLMNDPMANMAVQYGASLADHGKDVMEKQVWKPRLGLDWFILNNANVAFIMKVLITNTCSFLILIEIKICVYIYAKEAYHLFEM